MSLWKLLMFACTLHSVVCQELRHISEEELNGDEKFLDMSARGLVETFKLDPFSAWESVDYSNNAIANLDWSRFTSAPNLKTIDLSGNPDLALPENGPEIELPISVLNMTNCKVRIISKNSLNGLNSLDVLDLRGNPVSFEESTAFEDLATPPALLIVSHINKNDLKHVCKNVDMKIQIIDDDMTRDCKNVRLNSPSQPRASPDREKIYREVEGDDLLMSAGTHLEMQADEAVDGSGNDEGTQSLSEDNTNFDSKTQSPENGEGTPAEASTEYDGRTPTPENEGTNPAPEGDAENDAYTQPPEDVSAPPKIKPNLQRKIALDAIEGTQSAHGSDAGDAPRPVDAPAPPKIKPNLQRKLVPNAIEGSEGDTQAINEAAPPVGEVSKPASSSRSIILILIVAACIIGTAFGLMKYYKDRRNNRSASSSEVHSENLKEMRECEPLMYEELPENKKPNNANDCPDVVVDGAAKSDEQMSTKDMIMGLANLPDIDDPNRLSTIIASNTNLSPSTK